MDLENGEKAGVWNCKIDKSGRIVLPQALRMAKHLDNGEDLVVSIENGLIVIRTFDEALNRLTAQFRESLPINVSLADELIAERQEEAANEVRD